MPLIGGDVVFGDALPEPHFLKVQIFFDAPEDIVIDDASQRSHSQVQIQERFAERDIRGIGVVQKFHQRNGIR